MAQDDLRWAIQMMQDGQVDEAAGRLRRLVEAPGLDAKGRAAAFVWLAEASNDRDYKRRCLERALASEPDNAQIRQGLNQLLSTPAQPSHLPGLSGPPASPSHANSALPIAEIEGGRNGPASGILVSREGLLATTSYAVGSAEVLRIGLEGQPFTNASVARRFPIYDLAFIMTGHKLARLPALAPPGTNLAGRAVVARGCGGARLRGNLAADADSRDGHWLRTSIAPDQLPDAGGNPLLDEQTRLLGILTRNQSADGGCLALTMGRVLALAEQFRRDRQLMPRSVYCSCCGSLARAPSYGGLSCEGCGARMQRDQAGDARPEQLARLYGEASGPPCQHCGAHCGSHAGRCLRCGTGTRLGEAR